MTKQIIGVHDAKDLSAYLTKVQEVQRAPRALWLLRDFGYGTRKDDLVLDTKRYGERPTDLSAELIRSEENPDACVVDIGCGPGNSTEVILKYLPARRVIGIDPSKEFIDTAKKNLESYISEGRLEFKICKAEELSDHFPRQSVDLAYGMVVWQFFDNVRQALEEIQTVLKPGAKFTTFISSTHYEFELPQSSDGPITYLGEIGQIFLRELKYEFKKQLSINIHTDSRISHQYNNLGTLRELARASGLRLVKYEEKDWPYEKEVLPTKLKGEPRRIMMNDLRIRKFLEAGNITIDEVQKLIVEPVVERIVNSKEYQSYEGRFTERWAACVLQKPYFNF